MNEVPNYLSNLRRGLIRSEAILRPEKKNTAAVLVAMVLRGNALNIIYTRRSDRLSSHRGQVAFPGGRFDRRDSNLVATALRETHEEIGIAPHSIEVLGGFEGRETRSSEIFVAPFVGLVREPFELRPDPKEVAEIFEVPLAALEDRRYRGHYNWSPDGASRRFPAILYAGQTIWGLTYELTLRFLEYSRRAARLSRQPKALQAAGLAAINSK
ncbi:MAG TPA: CoA pyrophosphatase [Candidatus Binataceae bacterium]|nr:CoA pyrophosphatase [Candidatus Binataceae bacterium]